jgi:hypothetical protein
MTMSATDQILESALARLQIGWTRVHLAETATEESCDPCDEKAVAWCAIGAVSAAVEALGYDITKKASRRLYQQALYRVGFAAGCADDDWECGIEGAVSRWNDLSCPSQEDLVLAFKNALYG